MSIARVWTANFAIAVPFRSQPLEGLKLPSRPRWHGAKSLTFFGFLT
jgi:hypothetical protein